MAVQIAGRQAELLKRPPAGVTTTATLVVVMTGLIVALCRDWGGMADKLSHDSAMLIVIVYVLVAEANARITCSDTGATAVRAFMIAVLAAVVLVPLLYTGFAAAVLWPVAITAALVALAVIAASVALGRSG